eukprot:SAG11_NODE_9605_length_896_cov_1.675031_1_plen_32_part_10
MWYEVSVWLEPVPWCWCPYEKVGGPCGGSSIN